MMILKWDNSYSLDYKNPFGFLPSLYSPITASCLQKRVFAIIFIPPYFSTLTKVNWTMTGQMTHTGINRTLFPKNLNSEAMETSMAKTITCKILESPYYNMQLGK